MIGKPYSGKLNVRFDEGELETVDRYSPSRCVHRKEQKRLQPGASSLLYLPTPKIQRQILASFLVLYFPCMGLRE